jgi:plasmid stabilization system protein ParE
LTRLEWSEQAIASLDQVILSHSLPSDTRARIEHSAQVLKRFPRFGPELSTLADGAELRFLVGPWPWLLIVYLYIADENRAVVVSIEDGRAASTTITRQRKRVPRS